MTSATDNLRRLLDERGVEWDKGAFPNEARTYWQDVIARPWNEQRLYVKALLTPEQAVDATLGPGTCELEESWHGESEMVEYRCTACDEYMAVEVVKPDGAQRPNYCPNCGKRVVE